MKKLLMITMLATATAHAVESLEYSYSVNQMGMLQVESSLTNTIIAVPWVDWSADTNAAPEIVASNLVKTANLTDGDRLYVFNNPRYDVYELQNGAWESLKTVTAVDGSDVQVSSAEDAATRRLVRGSGLWLKRQKPLDENGKPIYFYLYGQYKPEQLYTRITAGTYAEPCWNLVAPPGVVNYDLNRITGAGEKDEIIVPTDKEPKRYYYDGGWYYTTNAVVQVGSRSAVKAIRVTDDTEVPRGTGFWYISNGGSPIISW